MEKEYNSDEILGILNFLKNQMEVSQFNRLIPYININSLYWDINGTLSITISLKSNTEINYSVKLIDAKM